MNKKNNRLSINSFEEIYKNEEHVAILDFSENFKVEVKKEISLVEASKLINSVVESCIEDGKYIPICKRFAFRKYVIEAYTNIALPENINKQYDFVYGTNVFTKIASAINPAQLAEICESIDEMIKQTVEDVAIQSRSEIKRIADSYEELLEKYKLMLTLLDETLGNTDFVELAKTIGSINEIDEDKILDALISKFAINTKDSENTEIAEV
ncbi:MAG: hypothetical protein RR365_00980 [Bacteroides sp.]